MSTDSVTEEKPAQEVVVESTGDKQAQVENDSVETQTGAGEADDTPKHPLQHKWVLWYDNPKKRNANESWEENLKQVYTFDTVEDFWCLYNNILAPTKLSVGSNYHLFKDGVRPMWEDEANTKGGKWIFTNPRGRRARLDESWLHVVLSLIGESLEDDDDVCGAVVSVRKAQDRIAIWTANAEKKELQLQIGQNFRKALVDVSKNETLKFQSHADAAASGSSFQNEVYYEA